MKKGFVKLLCATMAATLLLSACGEEAAPESIEESVVESQVESVEEPSSEAVVVEEEEEAIPILRDQVAAKMDARIGCAIAGAEAEDPKVLEILTTHFNAVTLGNELKPDALFNYSLSAPAALEEVEFNGETMTVPKLYYDRAEKILDKIVAWNEANPDRFIQVRGHVLVWHSQTQEWFFHEDYDKTKPYVDKATMTKRQEWYIKTVLEHFTGEDSKYKDLFYGWDVVNEAVSDRVGVGIRTDAENDESLSADRHGSNSSWWHIYQSNEYIINAFKFANKYAPADLELYYNDYNECDANKRLAICELLTAIKEQEGEPGVGTRISGMGMQGHYDTSGPAIDRFESTIKMYAKIVDSIQITEWDMKASSDYDGSDEKKESEYKTQAGKYRQYYNTLVYLKNTEGINITGITFWGTADHYSWLQSSSNVGGGADGKLKQCPLLFDDQYEPKPSFYVFAQ